MEGGFVLFCVWNLYNKNSFASVKEEEAEEEGSQSVGRCSNSTRWSSSRAPARNFLIPSILSPLTHSPAVSRARWVRSEWMLQCVCLCVYKRNSIWRRCTHTTFKLVVAQDTFFGGSIGEFDALHCTALQRCHHHHHCCFHQLVKECGPLAIAIDAMDF